ncbi:MAG: 3-hexulose-6-phosphate synthase [Parcubacteria group bacterium ADurb.Bin326]|nr:MAG: 3-hexulose-6-phosphate synthase [Parcubacteria group bacterium ADurb.Bin326]
MKLDRRKKYLQIAFNRSLSEVTSMIGRLEGHPGLIIEAGTPFIKRYGHSGLSKLATLWRSKNGSQAYLVADLKCMDRGFTEVKMARDAGASAATVLGLAPIETIDAFISTCKELGIDSMVDMMNVPFPFEVLQKLKKLPDIVVLHRGVDEASNKAKMIPYHEINRIKGAYNIMISIAGGEDLREAQRAFFNGADIAVVWKEFFQSPEQSGQLAQKFLTSIKRYAGSQQ